MRLSSPNNTHAATYTVLAVTTFASLLILLLTAGNGVQRHGQNNAVISAAPGNIPLHSVEISRNEHGRFVTPEGMDIAELAERIRTLPPEVPVPVVLIRFPASTELQSIAPALKEMENLGISKLAILME